MPNILVPATATGLPAARRCGPSFAKLAKLTGAAVRSELVRLAA